MSTILDLACQMLSTSCRFEQCPQLFITSVTVYHIALWPIRPADEIYNAKRFPQLFPDYPNMSKSTERASPAYWHSIL
jgi:hypothetical protein